MDRQSVRIVSSHQAKNVTLALDSLIVRVVNQNFTQTQVSVFRVKSSFRLVKNAKKINASSARRAGTQTLVDAENALILLDASPASVLTTMAAKTAQLASFSKEKPVVIAQKRQGAVLSVQIVIHAQNVRARSSLSIRRQKSVSATATPQI